MMSATIPATSGSERRTLFRLGGLRLRRRFRLGGDADLQRIDPDRPFDVLELRLAEIRDRHVEPAAHLAVGVLGQTDRAGRGDPFQSRGDVDAVAHQIAVALLDDVAQMNADAKFYALVERDPALRSTMACCTSSAQRTASTTLRNSMTLPSPVRLTMRP